MNSTHTDFWGEIAEQLRRVSTEKPQTFDAVRTILIDLAYPEIQKEIHRNGVRSFDQDSAFFAGSGGGGSIIDALIDAGWEITTFIEDYYLAMQHPATGEQLTYIEGDLERGDRIP